MVERTLYAVRVVIVVLKIVTVGRFIVGKIVTAVRDL